VRIQALLAEVDRVRPARIVIDSCSELRLLAQSPLRFRRQVLALKAELIKRTCTVVLLDNPGGEGNDLLQSLVHGVLHMEQLSPLYGAERRRMRVIKLREVSFRGGYHDLSIRHEGLVVFPRLVAAEHHDEFARDAVPSGIPVLDEMLGGGLERGTSALIMGPAGSGKSAIAVQYALAAAKRGERASMFTFDEGLGTLIARARGLGLELQPHIDSGHLTIQQVDPAELSPGEFVDRVRRTVVDGIRVLVIDSLNGYLHAMPEEQFMLAQMHEMLSYLRQQGLLSLLVVSQHGFLGHNMSSPIDVSYLADSVLLTRYFEAGGRVRKAISVVKKRAGKHEDSIRELALSSSGIVIGPALAGFRGILTGVPVYEGPSQRSLLDERHG
jgi:circadian clock protein KaiC